MKLLVSTATLLLASTSSRAFPVAPIRTKPAALKAKSSSSDMDIQRTEVDAVYFEDLEEAIACACKFGKCNVETLFRLADKVEAGANSCTFEVTEELCQKEIADRLDVAEILRMQAELQLRMEAMQLSSLFIKDVQDEHCIRQREDLLELLSEDSI